MTVLCDGTLYMLKNLRFDRRQRILGVEGL